MKFSGDTYLESKISYKIFQVKVSLGIWVSPGYRVRHKKVPMHAHSGHASLLPHRIRELCCGASLGIGYLGIDALTSSAPTRLRDTASSNEYDILLVL